MVSPQSVYGYDDYIWFRVCRRELAGTTSRAHAKEH
jgi:hypothetical protein